MMDIERFHTTARMSKIVKAKGLVFLAGKHPLGL